jgi:hypothetical protein
MIRSAHGQSATDRLIHWPTWHMYAIATPLLLLLLLLQCCSMATVKICMCC